MKASKNIEVNVECDIINKQVYVIAVESILKYILYQFQQIPVQIDILEKELTKPAFLTEDEFECLPEGTHVDNELNARQFLKQEALRRKTKVGQKLHERKRKRWLPKVELLVRNFQNTINVLQQEIENGVVTSTAYVVGSSPFTPKFVFKIHVPSNSNSQYFKAKSHCSVLPNLRRKILMNLLRSFANNDEMSKFSSKHFSLTKLWTLYEKETSNIFGMDKENSFCDMVQQTDFTIKPRTTVVEVFLNEKIQSIVEMELTPCVGAANGFIKPLIKKRYKRVGRQESFTKLDIYQKNKSIKNLELNLDLEDGVDIIQNDGDSQTVEVPRTPCVEDIHMNDENDEKMSVTSLYPQTPFNSGKVDYSSSIFNTPLFRMPHDPFDIMIETPVVCKNRSPTPSPVKRLALSISDICFTPTTKANLGQSKQWYQINTPLCGFRETLLSRC